MQTRDHTLLGRYLLASCDAEPDPVCRRMFLLGCIEPDCNLATYARGSIKHRLLHGHNAENARGHLRHLTEKLLESGVGTPLQWFRFGAALHYLADSFTFAHNQCFAGTLAEHRLYEKLLHSVFAEYLYPRNVKLTPSDKFTHEQYLQERRSFLTDCQYILGASIALWHQLSILQAMPKPIRCLALQEL